MKDKDITLYGLTGNPLGHSFSKSFFSEYFKCNGINATYENFVLNELSRNEIEKLVSRYPNLRGLNVTYPFKTDAFRIADCWTREASTVEASNCLKFTFDENKILKIHAHNTDVLGFREFVKEFASNQKALICGTGGAARAVTEALRSLSIDSLLLSRKPSINSNIIPYSDLTEELIQNHLIIVNATPLGMCPYENLCPPLPYDLISNKHLCIDLIYNPSETLFLKKCASKGAKTHNGSQMLVNQAIASLNFWQNAD